jgi:hypothetical protein
MTVYVIKDTEGNTLEICSSVYTAFVWLRDELKVEFPVKVKRLDSHLIIEAEDESYVILKWTVFEG